MNRLCGLRNEKSAYIQPKGSGYEKPRSPRANFQSIPMSPLMNIPQSPRPRNDIMYDKRITKIAPADSRIAGLFG